VTLIDAENVRRSEWPNIAKDKLAELVGRWANTVGAAAVLVFDGTAPEAGGPDRDGRLRIVGSGAESADDWIARAAAELARRGRPYRLVTSDRGLRARAGGDADDVVGGGTFARALSAT
jgi:YacP-like NYN domain